MPLSQSDRAELDRLGADNVRHRLSYSGPSRDAVIGSFGPGFSMTRGDVEEWLVEKSQEATKLQRDSLVGKGRHLGRRHNHFSDDSAYRLVLYLADRLKSRRIRYSGRVNGDKADAEAAADIEGHSEAAKFGQPRRLSSRGQRRSFTLWQHLSGQDTARCPSPEFRYWPATKPNGL